MIYLIGSDFVNEVNEQIVDIDDALKRIGGNMDLYKRLLGRFIDGNHIETLEDALLSGDTDEAARLAHTLKGVAANLSLVKLRTISTDLEELIKNGGDYSGNLADLRTAYFETATTIKEIMS